MDNHKDRCPWKSQQCDGMCYIAQSVLQRFLMQEIASIYCVPLKPPSALAKDIKKHAMELEESDILDGVEVRHPLVRCIVIFVLSEV